VEELETTVENIAEVDPALEETTVEGLAVELLAVDCPEVRPVVEGPTVVRLVDVEGTVVEG
jgi:hypothetical protein